MFGRSLYILAGTLTFFALVSFVFSVTHVLQEPGAPSDSVLWRTIGLFLLLGSFLVALAGVMQTMYEQAERRHEDEARKKQ
jgi:hypothetical protein